MNSGGSTAAVRRGGFPHSDISGSKLVCQLPEAFRRLPRPSSPVIAKASTTCTCSLDPITSVSQTCVQVRARDRMSSRICAVFQVIFRSLKYILVDTITTRYRVLLQRLINAHDTFTTSHIFKEQPTETWSPVVLAKPNASAQR